ncbi:hypothetical protein BX616_001905 [Lobosporangium transversale]|nr:hypothetical protein BX616_001905 [Lobosporangium transversale]
MSTDQLVSALQHLAAIGSIDTSRNQDLDLVAKRLQADKLGQDENVWKNLAMVLKGVVKNGLDPEHVGQLTCLLRIIRNCVANVSDNQNHARAGVQTLSNLLTGNEQSKNLIWKHLLVKAPSTSCDQNLLSTLVAIEDESIVLSTVMLCYNCIFNSQERSTLLFSTVAGKKLLVQLINESHAIVSKDDRKSFEMIYTFFNHLVDQEYLPELFESLKTQGRENEEEYSIRYHGKDFNGLKDPGELASKFRGLEIEEVEGDGITTRSQKSDHRKEGKKESFLSAEQVILLKFIDSRIYSHHQQQHQRLQELKQQHKRATNILSETEPPVSLKTLVFLLNLFTKVATLTIEVFETLDQPGVGQHEVEELANLSSGLMLLLGCFTYLSLFDDGVVMYSVQDVLKEDMENKEREEQVGEPIPVPEWFKVQHMTMVNHGLVESSIELLRQADKSLVRVTKPISAMSQSDEPTLESTTQSMDANTTSTLLTNTSTKQGQQSFFAGLKRDIVRLVGNLAYRSRHVQDLIRGCNGLVVMLSQCNIDDVNPYLREYAILAMKNILSGNLENQALIEELKPIEAVDHPALQEARLSTRLDTVTGRPVLSQKRP